MCYYKDYLVAEGKKTAVLNWIDNSFKDVSLTHETVTKNYFLAALGFYPITRCDLPKDHHEYSDSCDGIALIEKSSGVKQSMSKGDLMYMFADRYQGGLATINGAELTPSYVRKPRSIRKKPLKPARHILDTMSKRELTQLALDRGFKDGQEVEFSKNGSGISVRATKKVNPRYTSVKNIVSDVDVIPAEVSLGSIFKVWVYIILGICAFSFIISQ